MFLGRQMVKKVTSVEGVDMNQIGSKTLYESGNLLFYLQEQVNVCHGFPEGKPVNRNSVVVGFGW
jgi:hypothetical protein